jgi:hypothetical protein
MPPAGLGFIFPAGFLISEITNPSSSPDANQVAGLFHVAGTFYWFYLIYRMHKLVREMDSHYTVSPAFSVLLHLIPFFNFYWIMRWPSELSRFLRNNGVDIINGKLLGLLFLISFFISRFLDGSFGLTFVFILTTYMTNRLSLLAMRVKERQSDPAITEAYSLEKSHETNLLSS